MPSRARDGKLPLRARASAVPRQLPAATCLFTGRVSELAALDGMLDGAGRAVVISTIGGAAGIGKTALAVYWAHQVAARFPDGQLYANLRGFGPADTPATSSEVITGFLDALGVPPNRIPVDLADQAALYRSLLAGRRVLVILDNARDGEQVRPLLPGSPGCLVLVTSRAQLTGLVAAEGAHQVTLGLFNHDDARDLLARRLGTQRIAREPEAVDELIHACARLPLAISIAAAQATTRPALSLGSLAVELREEPGRLDAFDTGDPVASVRTVFSWSYRQLSGPDAKVFRLLGMHPGPDFSLPSAVSLTGLPFGDARAALTRLARAHLLTEHVPGRYSFHDLLHSYAAEQAQVHDDSTERRDAVQRVLDHYLYTADAGTVLLNPTRVPLGLPAPDPAVRPETFSDEFQALAWFETEHQTLLAAVACASGQPDARSWQLPWSMGTFFCRQGFWHEWVTTHQAALECAQRIGDRTGQAMVHHGLGVALNCLGSRPGACAQLRQAIDLFGASGSTVGEARSEFDLGWTIATGGTPPTRSPGCGARGTCMRRRAMTSVRNSPAPRSPGAGRIPAAQRMPSRPAGRRWPGTSSSVIAQARPTLGMSKGWPTGCLGTTVRPPTATGARRNWPGRSARSTTRPPDWPPAATASRRTATRRQPGTPGCKP